MPIEVRVDIFNPEKKGSARLKYNSVDQNEVRIVGDYGSQSQIDNLTVKNVNYQAVLDIQLVTREGEDGGLIRAQEGAEKQGDVRRIEAQLEIGNRITFSILSCGLSVIVEGRKWVEVNEE